MNSLWNETDRKAMLGRIESIAADARPRWGKMTAGAMLAHLTQSMKMACGEIHCRTKQLPFRYFPLKQLIVYLLPFPKGSPTAPELLEGADIPAEQSKAELRRLFSEFASRNGTHWPEHPAFGTLTESQWGVLSYRHLDHHLRQFDV
jgi:hypothetical protein